MRNIAWRGVLAAFSFAVVSFFTYHILPTIPLNDGPASALPSFLSDFISADDPQTTQTPLTTYIKVTDSCGPYFEGACVNARSEPSEDSPVVTQLRTGVVLKVSENIEQNGRLWHKVVFDEWLRYPERTKEYFYVADDYVETFLDVGTQEGSNIPASSTKWILIDRSEQTLTASDGDVVFMREKISTGLEFTPTPRGTFTIFRKTPSRYMQGPIPGISEKKYDLPGVPWNLYFTEQGAVIHGAYWHDHFGQQWSSGCVNLPPDKAEMLYKWADLGTRVVVRD